MGSDDVLPIYLAELDTQEEKDKFAELYEKYSRKMYHIALSILKNPADAEDAVDMAFHRLAKNFTKISKKSSNEIKAYIVICIRSAAIDVYRANRKALEKTCSLNEDDYSENLWEQEIDRISIISAIRSLPDDYRDVIFLCEYQMLTSKEAAKLLNTTDSNVRVKLHKARKKLKMILKGGDIND